MAKKPPPPPDERDSVAREVDKLLRQLPGADPTLRGGPEERSVDRPAAGRVRRPPGSQPPVRSATPSGPTTRDRIATWGLVVLGAVLGVALTGWPYAHACGFPLFMYLSVVLVVQVVAGWAAMSSWRFRLPVAHVAALVVAFWGIVLAAEQVLPRVGYAAAKASWGCPPAPLPVVTLPAIRAAPPPASDSVSEGEGAAEEPGG